MSYKYIDVICFNMCIISYKYLKSRILKKAARSKFRIHYLYKKFHIFTFFCPNLLILMYFYA